MIRTGDHRNLTPTQVGKSLYRQYGEQLMFVDQYSFRNELWTILPYTAHEVGADELTKIRAAYIKAAVRVRKFLEGE